MNFKCNCFIFLSLAFLRALPQAWLYRINAQRGSGIIPNSSTSYFMPVAAAAQVMGCEEEEEGR